MPSITLALLCLAVAETTTGFRVRSTKTNSSSALQLKGADCDALDNIVVGGRDLSKPSQILCRFWPASFGEFPVDNAKRIVDLMNGAEDLWRKIKELAKGRPGGSPFCWKQLSTRQVIDQTLLDDHLSVVHTVNNSMQGNCDVQMFGKCYGSCRAGHKSAKLVGGFLPVCTSECTQTTHKRSCGFGCASSRLYCAKTVADQVFQVTRTVGLVGSYLTGQPIIHEVVDKVLRLVEFAVDTLWAIVRVGKTVFEQWPKEEKDLGVIIGLLGFILESAKELGQDFNNLKNYFGETIELVLELIDTELTWKQIDLKFISDTILKHGSKILDASYELTKVFIFPKCAMA